MKNILLLLITNVIENQMSPKSLFSTMEIESLLLFILRAICYGWKYQYDSIRVSLR